MIELVKSIEKGTTKNSEFHDLLREHSMCVLAFADRYTPFKNASNNTDFVLQNITSIDLEVLFILQNLIKSGEVPIIETIDNDESNSQINQSSFIYGPIDSIKFKVTWRNCNPILCCEYALFNFIRARALYHGTDLFRSIVNVYLEHSGTKETWKNILKKSYISFVDIYFGG